MAGAEQRALSFGAIADGYDRLRPPAPEEALDWLVPDRCDVAVDLAAGTGLFTRLLASRIPEVIAVEPDERMRTVLTARSPALRVLEGRGEAIPLPEASADAVFISSAWHWMDADRALQEIARVLRDGGRFGVIWTGRDRAVDWIRDLDDSGERAADARRHRGPRREVELGDTALFSGAEKESFRFVRRMAIDDVVDMFGTYSRLIALNADDRAAALARRRAVLDTLFPGAAEVDVPMGSWCWRANRTARTV
jgi:SAM-dependent methyltransferase